MQLRARLALLALVLMLVPTIALSVISLDYRIGEMVDDMSHSTDFMIAQIFEQVRLAWPKAAATSRPRFAAANRCARRSIRRSRLGPP